MVPPLLKPKLKKICLSGAEVMAIQIKIQIQREDGQKGYMLKEVKLPIQWSFANWATP